ncbi:MAG: DNA-3-methyladenine glycosylase [Bacilli bacterium]|nr:DNA-3-methyladenine glycosylase [Bacilli bacterium]
MRLGRDFYTTTAYTLAQNLLGKVLCIIRNGKLERYRIIETEAYGGSVDKASHAYNYLRTNRNDAMYLIGGHLYVYFIYGMYYMLNISASVEENPEAVLIRALEPLQDIPPRSETNGPGKLCRKLGIDRSFNKLDLVTSDVMYIEDDGYQVKDIVQTKRINIDYAEEDKDRLWRFYIKDNPHVSRK